MPKIPLTDVGSLGNPSSARQNLNENFDRIELAFDNMLDRKGRSPNQMEAEIDMGDHKILNVSDPENDNDAVNKRSVRPLVEEFAQDIIMNAVFGEIVVDVFVATAGQTDFLLTASPGSINNVELDIDGVSQAPSLDFSIGGAGLQTLSVFTPCVVGQRVMVRYARALPSGIAASGSVTYTRPSTGVAGTIKSYLDLIDSSTGGTGVGFTASGAGATVRNVQTKLRERVSAKDFGAVADGVTDDRAAIVAAIAASDEVVLTEGTYLITGAPITIPNGKRIVGDGGLISSAGNTPVRIVRAGGSAFSFFVMSPGSELHNIWLGRTGAAAITGGKVIDCTGASGCVLTDLIVESCWDGVYMKNVAGMYIQRVHIGDWQNAGINCDGNNNDIFYTESILNGGVAPGTGVRLFDKIESFIMTNCDVIAGGAGLTTSASGAMIPGNRAIPQFNKISNVYFDSSQGGVVLDKCNLMTFTSCWFSTTYNNSGVVVNEALNTSFVGCEFFNNWLNGANLNSSSQKGTKFVGCRFANNNMSTLGSAGMLVNNNVTDFSVTDCTFDNSIFATPTQAYGMFIGTGADRFNVIGGNFGTHPTSKFTDNSSASADKHISNNIGFKTSATFAVTVPSGSTSYFFNHGLDVTPAVYEVVVTPAQDPGQRYWVGATNATQIGMGFSAALGSNTVFSVHVRSKGA